MHPIRRTAAWVLADERAPDAPGTGYRAACLACSAESAWVADDPAPVELWVLDHTTHHGLAHSQFVVTTQRHWRVIPRTGAAGMGSVLNTVRPPRVRANRPHGARAHARRRRWRPRRMLSRLRRLGAPQLAVSGLVVASMMLALVLVMTPALHTD